MEEVPCSSGQHKNRCSVSVDWIGKCNWGGGRMATGWERLLETRVLQKGYSPSLHNIPLDLIC